jgi:hypothetical protein
VEIIAVIGGILKFFDQVKWFVGLLQKTPMEKVNQVMAEVDAAFKKAELTNDTSEIEDILNG